MIKIKKQNGIEKMRQAGLIIGLLWEEMGKIVVPGISTWDLDKFADDFIRSHDAYPAFKGFSVKNECDAEIENSTTLNQFSSGPKYRIN
jgi:methionine aminopeptidase